MSYEKAVGKIWFSAGFSFKQIAIGFNINRRSLSVDLLFFWIGLEF
jgi:hypothetical protein